MSNSGRNVEDPLAGKVRHPFWAALKWILFLLVLAFVGRHASRLWSDFNTQKLVVRWGWLAAAAAASALSWLPSVWFWRKLLAALGARPPIGPMLRAYYCGHLGKYVPGKAMVIAIRATMLSSWGVPAATTAYSVTLDTLTFMAAGVITVALLLPTIVAALPEAGAFAEISHNPWWRIIFPVIAIVGSIGGLAVLSRLSVRIANRLQGAVPAVGSLAQPVPVRTFAVGLLVYLAAWWLQGALVGLTLQGLSAAPVSWSDWPLWTGASAVSLVGGFVAVFAPGGLGVREGLLMELLRQQAGAQEAVAAALVLRAATLIGELVFAGAFYFRRSLVR